jgi:hypothetical protein
VNFYGPQHRALPSDGVPKSGPASGIDPMLILFEQCIVLADLRFRTIRYGIPL